MFADDTNLFTSNSNINVAFRNTEYRTEKRIYVVQM